MFSKFWLTGFHHAVVWILLVSSQQVLICFGGVFSFLWKSSRLALLLRGSFILLWFLLIVPVFNEILLPCGWTLNISKSYVTPGNFWNLKCIWNSFLSKYTPWIVFIDSYFMFWGFFACIIFVLIWIDFSNCFHIDNSFLWQCVMLKICRNFDNFQT